jgi:glycosyltransferase involved in cell wall biosynthesis
MLHALPDTVVHSHGYKANVVARIARLRGAPMRGLVSTSHGFDSYARRLAFYNSVDRFTAFASSITTVTDPRMAQKFPPWTKARYVANALPAQAPPTEALRQNGRAEFEWAQDQFAVGMLHRLIPQKGVDVFLAAAALAKRWDRSDILWVIAGEGPQRELVENAARENPNIIYVGYVDPPDMYLAALDAFVQPSRSEGLSLALLQAMRATKSIVATRVGATELTVRDGYEGVLIDAEDPAAIAAAVILLADDRAHAARLAEAARARFVREFQIERQATAFLDLYKEASSGA